MALRLFDHAVQGSAARVRNFELPARLPSWVHSTVMTEGPERSLAEIRLSFIRGDAPPPMEGSRPRPESGALPGGFWSMAPGENGKFRICDFAPRRILTESGHVFQPYDTPQISPPR